MHAITHQFLKINSAMFGALIITFGLFFLMQLLIKADENRTQNTYVVPFIDATVPEFETVLFPPLERPKPVLDPVIPDVTPQVRETGVGNGPVIFFQPPQVSVDAPAINRWGIEDSSMVPMIRTPPVYPTRALQRNISGFVVVSFTVGVTGNVEDATVVYAEPEGYFESAALQSLARWRYAPKVENGNPVPVYGVEQRIVFEIRN